MNFIMAALFHGLDASEEYAVQQSSIYVFQIEELCRSLSYLGPFNRINQEPVVFKELSEGIFQFMLASIDILTLQASSYSKGSNF